MKTYIDVSFSDQKVVHVTAPRIATGGVQEDVLRCTFDDSWSGYTKTAVFYQDEANVHHVEMPAGSEVTDIYVEFEVPAEVLTKEGFLFVGVFGELEGEIKTSEVVRIKIVKGAITTATAGAPHLNIYQQLLDRMNQLEVSAVKIDISALTAEGENLTGIISADEFKRVYSEMRTGRQLYLVSGDKTLPTLVSKAYAETNDDNDVEHVVEAYALDYDRDIYGAYWDLKYYIFHAVVDSESNDCVEDPTAWFVSCGGTRFNGQLHSDGLYSRGQIHATGQIFSDSHIVAGDTIAAPDFSIGQGNEQIRLSVRSGVGADNMRHNILTIASAAILNGVLPGTADHSAVNLKQLREALENFSPDEVEYGLLVGDDGKLYLTKDGETSETEGVELPESGVAFVEWIIEKNAGDDKYYLHLYDANGDDVIPPCELPEGIGSGGTGGGDTGSTVRITNRMPARTFAIASTDADCNILYSWTSVDNEDSSETGAGTVSWYVGNQRVAVQRNVAQGNQTFDIKPYLTAGATNAVKVVVEDAYGTTKSSAWTITVNVFGLTWNLPGLANHGERPLSIRLIPTGSGDKTLHVSVDGTEIVNKVISKTGYTDTETVEAQTHGAHTILAWLETVVDGETLQSEVLRHTGIWTVAGDSTPIVAAEFSEVAIPQFETKQISYMVYDPGNEEVPVELKIDGVTKSIVTCDRGVHAWSYKPTAVGNHALGIACGTASATISATITSLGIEVSPVTNGLVMDIDPSGHSNEEVGFDSFGYKDALGINHPFEFSDNFDFENGGFKTDSDGVTAFVIKRGTFVRFDRSLFNDDAMVNGKEIKLIFKAINCRNYDAVILDNVSERIGLKVRAQNATVSSMSKSIVAQYCEDSKIELDVNIESSGESKIFQIWLEGVPSKADHYTASDNWQQPSPTAAVLGSDDCDIWLYRFKMYGNSLSRQELIDNFVADCADIGEMVDRYRRNDIFTSAGAISIEKLAAASPALRIIHISAPRMTTAKEDVVLCDVALIYEAGGGEYKFTATGVKMKAQGTSSMDYYLAALNLDLDFSSAVWTNGNGEAITDFAMTENDIPVNYFNIKLNVASSENANNVILADEYNEYQPHITPARAGNPKVRDTIAGYPCAVFFTNTSDSQIAIGARTLEAGATTLYGCGDMNNSKKNYAVFGQDNSVWPEQCCVEILNNNNRPCLFQENIPESEGFDGDGDFEFRYPKNPTDGMISAFREMHSWVVSTNTAAATGNPLSAPVVYNGVPYTTDTAQYRAAKFKNELANYFSVSSALYHYLFTDRHCMVDNRAKNVFVSYEYDEEVGEYRWNFCKDYDNDTAEGNDNVGDLTFTYGMEDTDFVGSRSVFNAADSVLWCNIRDYMADELATLFRDREAAGAWKADRILAKFEAHQSARPEALVAEDMHGKYIMPYLAEINSGAEDSSYLSMLFGNKTDQRRQFELYQEMYKSSQYSGSVASASAINLRGTTPDYWEGVAPSGDMEITPYADMYIWVKYGNAGTVKLRAKRNISYAIDCPAHSLNNTEVNIYGARNISHIGSLAGIYTDRLSCSMAVKLRQLILGSGAAGYVNENLESMSVASNTMLEVLDVRGLTSIAHDLDLSNLTALREIYTTNSAITGVTFAKGAPLETIALNAIYQLTARQLSKVSAFAGYGQNLNVIRVEDSPGIDTYALVAAATGIYRGRLTGVDWEADNADAIIRLTHLTTNGGIDAQGNTVPKFVLTGACHIAAVTAAELAAISDAFPDLEVTYDAIVPAYTITFQNYDGTVLYTESVRSGESAIDPVAAGFIDAPTKPKSIDYVYTYTAWDTPLNNISGNLTVTALYSQADRVLTVKWHNAVGVVLQTKTCNAYDNVEYTGGNLQNDGDRLWIGWDKSTVLVTDDLDVYPLYLSPEQPASVIAGQEYLYSDDASDESAYTLAELYWIFKNGRGQDYMSAGDRIKIVMPSTAAGNGINDTTIIAKVAGFNRYKLGDGSGRSANVMFHMVGLAASTKPMNAQSSNAGGWKESSMRTYLNGTYLPNLPLHWRQLIKTVNVRSTIGGGANDNHVTGITTSSDKLFLLCYAEVFGATATSEYIGEISPDVVAESATKALLPIFPDSASRIRKYTNGTGSAYNWWLRSPVVTSATYYQFVYNNGSSGTNNASYSNGVAFGFCCGEEASA